LSVGLSIRVLALTPDIAASRSLLSKSSVLSFVHAPPHPFLLHARTPSSPSHCLLPLCNTPISPLYNVSVLVRGIYSWSTCPSNLFSCPSNGEVGPFYNISLLGSASTNALCRLSRWTWTCQNIPRFCVLLQLCRSSCWDRTCQSIPLLHPVCTNTPCWYARGACTCQNISLFCPDHALPVFALASYLSEHLFALSCSHHHALSMFARRLYLSEHQSALFCSRSAGVCAWTPLVRTSSCLVLLIKTRSARSRAKTPEVRTSHRFFLIAQTHFAGWGDWKTCQSISLRYPAP
jgi:hypothetical protein